MDQGLLDSLLDAIHTVLPDAEYVDGENVQFLDSCGCYSEYTTEPCGLTVPIIATVPEDSSEHPRLGARVDDAVETWANSHLDWSGCDSCDNLLSIYTRVYPRKQGLDLPTED